MRESARRTNPAILTDKEVQQVGYFTPFTFLHGVEEFKPIIKAACSSAAGCGIKAESMPTQVILAMRNIYFLGVQHGAEQYRRTMAQDRSIPRRREEEPPQQMRFEAPPGTVCFARYLSAGESMKAITQIFGMKGV